MHLLLGIHSFQLFMALRFLNTSDFIDPTRMQSFMSTHRYMYATKKHIPQVTQMKACRDLFPQKYIQLTLLFPVKILFDLEIHYANIQIEQLWNCDPKMSIPFATIQSCYLDYILSTHKSVKIKKMAQPFKYI